MIARQLFDWVLPPPIEGRHQTGVHLDLVSPLGAPDDDWRPEIDLDESEATSGREALVDALGPAGSGLRILVHPGAGKLANRWPAERFGEVVRVQQRVVSHDVGVFPGDGTRLEVEVNDFFQRLAQTEDQVSSLRYRGKIDVEQSHWQGGRPVKCRQEPVRAKTAHVLQRGVKRHGHDPGLLPARQHGLV